MDKHICKAKRIDNNEWMEGYFVGSTSENGFIARQMKNIASWNIEPVYTNTVCRYTGMNEFVMTDKSINQPLFEGDIVEVNSLRRPYAAYPQSKYDGDVKVRAVIYFDRGQWMLDYDNQYNNKMCETRGNEQYERSVEGAWELYYCSYKGKPEYEDQYRENNKLYRWSDIVKIGNIHENPELLEV